jgi:hypothetical protein
MTHECACQLACCDGPLWLAAQHLALTSCGTSGYELKTQHATIALATASRSALHGFAFKCRQAAAGFVTADAEAQHFHLSPAQQLVLTNEYGPDASPFFAAGSQCGTHSLLHGTCTMASSVRGGGCSAAVNSTCRHTQCVWRHGPSDLPSREAWTPCASAAARCAGFIQAASVAIKTAPIKDGFLTGRGWTYDAAADQTDGDSVCGTCRCCRSNSGCGAIIDLL